MVMYFVVFVAVLGGALVAWLRLTPSDPARWHVSVTAMPNKLDGGVVRMIPGGRQTLLRLDGIARATPRTQLLAGSPDEGRITYVTRTRFWGFPDYTTLQLNDDQIAIFARLRFGRRDFGVNSARVDAWLERLETVQQG